MIKNAASIEVVLECIVGGAAASHC